jgi:hypothetical protein
MHQEITKENVKLKEEVAELVSQVRELTTRVTNLERAVIAKTAGTVPLPPKIKCNNIPPLTQKLVDQMVIERYTAATFAGGIVSLTNFILDITTIENESERNYVCGDKSRCTFKYLNEERKWVKDVKPTWIDKILNSIFKQHDITKMWLGVRQRNQPILDAMMSGNGYTAEEMNAIVTDPKYVSADQEIQDASKMRNALEGFSKPRAVLVKNLEKCLADALSY